MEGRVNFSSSPAARYSCAPGRTKEDYTCASTHGTSRGAHRCKTSPPSSDVDVRAVNHDMQRGLLVGFAFRI